MITKKIEYIKENAKKPCRCISCDGIILKGEYKVRVKLPNNTVSAHIKCEYKGSPIANSDRLETTNNYGDSNNCKEHIVTIIADREDNLYFRLFGFSVKPLGKKIKATLKVDNGFTAGHIVNTAIKNNYIVKVNNVRYNSFNDYKDDFYTIH